MAIPAENKSQNYVRTETIEQALQTIQSLKKELQEYKQEVKRTQKQQFGELANRIALVSAENVVLKERITQLEVKDIQRTERMKMIMKGE